MSNKFTLKKHEPYRSSGGHMRLIDRERPEGAL